MKADIQDERYASAAAEYGRALERLARAYEADPDQRRDLLQDIHVALWKSMAVFDERCSVRTWVYRVAHNAASSHITRRRRANTIKLASLDELADAPGPENPEQIVTDQQGCAQLLALIRALKSPDREVMLLYLEDHDAGSIGEITGLSAGAIATRIHRIKTILGKRFQEQGGTDANPQTSS
jgi:RNA polymerase sigma-70 factor, ECF subfamily